MSAPIASRLRRKAWTGLGVLLLAALLGVMTWLLWPATPVAVASAHPLVNDTATIERGRYLSVLGNCQACHTQRGGQPFAGGRRIPTPFGNVYGSNLTPSTEGLAAWNADDFWRALHHGQARDGRLLSPAFPYTNTTHITRADSDALFAYLRSLPAVNIPKTPNEMRWPFDTQAALRVWRALYFRPQAATTTVDQQSDLSRGAYLVNGLGHCSACHMSRNTLGGNSDMLDLSGGVISAQNWYAPSLVNPRDAGVQDWALNDIIALFQSGRAQDHLTTGPMAEVVQHSTQHWHDADLRAMATYLQQLPRTSTDKPTNHPSTHGLALTRGAQTYEQHCASCHGKQGQGISLPNGEWAYPPLKDNATVRQVSPANLIQSVLHGGFPPSTAAHPRPFGMPPFVMAFNNQELADLLTYIRGNWGDGAGPVSALDVQKLREPTRR